MRAGKGARGSGRGRQARRACSRAPRCARGSCAPPGGRGAPNREAGVCAHADCPAPGLLRGDTRSSPLLPGCSLAESCVLGIASGTGESALHRACMVGAATTRMDISNLLQALPWMLAGPGHAVRTEGVFRGCAGQSQSPLPSPGCPKQTHQLFLTQDTCKLGDLLVRRLSHTHCFPHSHALSPSGSLVLHHSPCEIATRTTPPSPKSMLSGLCSVLIPEWEHLDPGTGAPLQSCRVRAGQVFISRGRMLSACLLTM